MILGDTGSCSSNRRLVSWDEHQQNSPETAHASETMDGTPLMERSDTVVVYDNRDTAFILARTLGQMGYQAHTVSYKRGMLSGLRERGYRLVVLEVKTADTSGLGRLEDIREADPGPPVILASGVGDSIGRILWLGVEAWTDRPFPLEEVRTAVQKVPWLEGWRGTRTLNGTWEGGFASW